jgi:hypothetical protein
MDKAESAVDLTYIEGDRMAMTKTEVRRIARAAGCVLGIAAMAACVTRGEFEELKKQVAQGLSYRPQDGDREKLVQATHDALQKRVTEGAKSEDIPASKLARTKLELALRDPNGKPSLGSVDVHCFPTICQAKTTHPSQEAYASFLKAAFSIDENTGDLIYPRWFTVAHVDSDGPARRALIYLGRLEEPTPGKLDETPSRRGTTVPQ